jgi:hypothetical protein
MVKTVLYVHCECQFKYCYGECHSAGCHSTECRDAFKDFIFNQKLQNVIESAIQNLFHAIKTNLKF